MSLRVGLAVADALEPLLSRPVQVKWPNDLMLGDRKVGGILCEARWQGGVLGWVAVGVGVNVRNPVPNELRLAAVPWRRYVRRSPSTRCWSRSSAALRKVDLQAERLSAVELDRFAERDWLSGREIGAPIRGLVRDWVKMARCWCRSPTGPRFLSAAARWSWLRSPLTDSFDHAPCARHRQYRDHGRLVSWQ